MSTGQLLVTGLGLGFAYGAAPGAVNTESLRRGLARGFFPALLVEVGALLGDCFWAVLAFSGSAFLVQSKPLRVVLGIAGACFLLRLAWSALHAAWMRTSDQTRLTDAPTISAQAQRRGDLATGIFFSLANPFALAFWSGIGGGVALSAGEGSHLLTLGTFLCGFFFGALLWCPCVPLLVGIGRRYVHPGLFRGINAACGVLIGYFGLSLLWSTLHDIFTHSWEAMWPSQRPHVERVWRRV